MKMVALSHFNLCLVCSNACRGVLIFTMAEIEGKGNNIKFLETSCSYFTFLINRLIIWYLRC